MTLGLPKRALSIRQPWAHALAAGWKPLENRGWRKGNMGLRFRGHFCIHASQGMTRQEYEHAAGFIASLGYVCPAPNELLRGGIIGVATVTSIVRESDSPWFFGPLALEIEGARPIKFVPAAGALGFFDWKEAPADYAPKPAKWMLPRAPEQIALTLPEPRTPDLFG